MASFLNSVKILEVCKVAPAWDSSQSEREFSFPLTYFDLIWLRFPPSSSLFFFKLNDSSGIPSFFHSVIFPRLKHSLSQTLLYFLPLAGGVIWPSSSPKPVIVLSPNNAHSVLTLAESNADFDRFSGNEFRESIESHPYVPELLVSDSIVSSLALQITYFPNKGFCIGLTTPHGVLDGKSTSMFINAWAYICRNGEKGKYPNLLPELAPYLDRTTIHDTEGLESACLNHWLTTTVPGADHSNPRSLKLGTNLGVEPNNLVRATFQLHRDAINKLRQTVLHHYNQASLKCTKKFHLSTHVLTCAYVFVCLLKAQRVDRKRKVSLGFPVDCRSRLNPQVPQNYFGNCIMPNCIIEEAGVYLKEDGVAIAVEKLSDAINGLERDLLQRTKEMIATVHHMGQEVLEFGIAGWTRIGFYGIDFGWGPVGKVEITHIDKTNGFSITETGDGREGAQIGVVLTRTELECFVSQFDNGLKAI